SGAGGPSGRPRFYVVAEPEMAREIRRAPRGLEPGARRLALARCAEVTLEPTVLAELGPPPVTLAGRQVWRRAAGALLELGRGLREDGEAPGGGSRAPAGWGRETTGEGIESRLRRIREADAERELSLARALLSREPRRGLGREAATREPLAREPLHRGARGR
ncbi:MAG: hypothetical protein ACRDYD_13360, partial [Acidimicrobiales bacterium]